MTEQVAPLVPKEHMEFFIKFANQVLERHDGEHQTRVRVFDHALWSVATPEQWSQWNVWIKESLSEAKYEQVQAAIQAWIDHQQQAHKKADEKTEQAMPAKHGGAKIFQKIRKIMGTS